MEPINYYQPHLKYTLIDLLPSKTLPTFVAESYLKLCRAMQCVARLPLLYRYLHLYKKHF